jgi:BAI1-associated protein 3
MAYLDNNLLTLNSNLLKSNFDRILQSIWEELLEEFKDVMDTEEPVRYMIYIGTIPSVVRYYLH